MDTSAQKVNGNHGKLMVRVSNGKLIVINDIDLENYLKGVVPSEMPPSWEMEALKAQAIAARSFCNLQILANKQDTDMT